MVNFLFDTADCDKIKGWWDKLKDRVDPNCVLGVTTNPNALMKYGVKDFEAFIQCVNKLYDLVYQIRRDCGGVIHVQIPNTLCTLQEIELFLNSLRTYFPAPFRLSVKIPPRLDILKNLSLFEGFQVNVTGVTDCLTAARLFSYPVDYVSFLTGRLEERGVDVQNHISYLSHFGNLENKNIIAGSMRTVAQLKWVSEYGCIPTIGETLWNDVFEKDAVDVFTCRELSELGTEEINRANLGVCGEVALAFFHQMDNAGQDLYTDCQRLFLKTNTVFDTYTLDSGSVQFVEAERI